MKVIRKTLFTWLITVSAGSIILAAIFSSLDKSSWLKSSFTESITLFLPLSAALSIPGMIAYHYIALYLTKINHSTLANKLYLSLIAVVLTLISCYCTSAFLFPANEIAVFFSILLFAAVPYATPFILSVWLFDYSKNITTYEQPREISDSIANNRAKKYLLAISLIASIPYFSSLSNFITTFTLKYYTPGSLAFSVIYYLGFPLSLILLWQRKKAGWFILTYFSISALADIYNITSIVSRLLYLNFFTYIPWLMYLLGNLIIAILLYKKTVYNYIGIGKKTRLFTFFVTIGIVFITYIIRGH